MFLTISDLARVRKIFLKGQDIFFGVLPSRIQAVGGAKFVLGKVKTIFWGFGFHFSETDFLIWGFGDFVRPQEGFGEECGRACFLIFFLTGLNNLLGNIDKLF